MNIACRCGFDGIPRVQSSLVGGVKPESWGANHSIATCPECGRWSHWPSRVDVDVFRMLTEVEPAPDAPATSEQRNLL